MSGSPAAVSAEYTAKTARNSVTVAGWTLLSRVTGLLRVMVIGAVMGPTFFANTFQAGYVVPNIVFTAMAGPVLAMVVVPSLVRAVTRDGLPRAASLLGRLSGCLLAVSVIIALLLVVVSPLIAWTLTFGIPDPADQARARQLTTLLVLFVAPQVVLYTVAGIGVAAQQARGHFALAAAAPAVENLGLIATVIAAGAVYGTGLQVDDVPWHLVVVLGIGSTLAVAVHAALQVFGAARRGLALRISTRWRDDAEAVAAARRIFRCIGVAACPAAAMYILLALAGSVPGGVLVVQLAYTVFYALSYLSGRAVSMAALPGLSAAAERDDGVVFASAWRQGWCYALVASLPLVTLLVVFAGPVADLIANGEMRQSDVIGQLAACLVVVAVAQLAGGLHDLGRQTLFARLDDRGPRVASILALGATLVVAALALTIPAGGARLTMLTVGILVGEAVGACWVLLRVRRALVPNGIIDVRTTASLVGAAAVTVPVAAAGAWLLAALDAGRLCQLALLALGGLATVGVYVLALRLSVWRSGALRRGPGAAS